MNRKDSATVTLAFYRRSFPAFVATMLGVPVSDRMAGDRVERSLLKLSGLVAESATTALKHERTP